jgi:hypothetical protein
LPATLEKMNDFLAKSKRSFLILLAWKVLILKVFVEGGESLTQFYCNISGCLQPN